ncbi:Hypothetical protein A7982_06187 [Minicystis rosea]|nr:Hypothetical protein A7982_06187 [Minicystis rosea]
MTKHLFTSLFIACSIFIGCAAPAPTESEGDAEGSDTTEIETPASPGETLHPQLNSFDPGDAPPCDCSPNIACPKGKTCHMYDLGYCGRCG